MEDWQNPIAEDVERVAAEVLFRGCALGQRYSVGPLTTAVPEPHDWAVLDLQGSLLVKAHDLFEAARWFVKLEQGDCEAPEGLALASDEELLVVSFLERADQHRHSHSWWVIDSAREKAMDAARADFVSLLAHRGNTLDTEGGE